nr:TlpA disulfide reductase family protein [Simplicispira psychrophila]
MPPRRRALYALVAAAAGASGAGWAWWKFRPHGADTALDSEQTLWAQHFQTPDGAALAMQAFQGRPLVVNFWATWCPPCIAELPLLNDFFQQNSAQGWQVVGLAVDQPAAVRSFLARAPVHFPIGMAGLGGTELARALGNLTGGLPFTVVLGRGGQVLHRKIGQIKAQDLQRWRESSGG